MRLCGNCCLCSAEDVPSQVCALCAQDTFHSKRAHCNRYTHAACIDTKVRPSLHHLCTYTSHTSYMPYTWTQFTCNIDHMYIHHIQHTSSHTSSHTSNTIIYLHRNKECLYLPCTSSVTDIVSENTKNLHCK